MQSSQPTLIANTSASQSAHVHHNRLLSPTPVHTSNTAQLSLCMQTLCEETKGDAIITTGVGQHQICITINTCATQQALIVHTNNTAELRLCMQTLCEETKGDAIITTGVGQHQMWAAQWYKYNEPRRWASSGGLGSMGFGLPSALGAAVAWDGTDKGRPKKVISS